MVLRKIVFDSPKVPSVNFPKVFPVIFVVIVPEVHWDILSKIPKFPLKWFKNIPAMRLFFLDLFQYLTMNSGVPEEISKVFSEMLTVLEIIQLFSRSAFDI